MLSCDSIERALDHSIEVEPLLIDKVVQALMIEQPLHFTEDSFYWVKLWAITHIEHRGDLQLSIIWLDFL